MTTSGTYYVYEHWRLDRDECFYVGKGKAGRAYSSKNRNRHHKAICAKLSREGFAMEVRMVAVGLFEKEAFALEIERIQFWREAGVDLVNVTNGGEGTSGMRHSDEVKKRISALNKGKSAAFKGRKHTEETKAVLSAKAKLRGPSKLTAEVIEKIAQSHRGRKRSYETCLKISEAKKGKPNWAKGKPSKLKGTKRSPEVRQKMAEAKRKYWQERREKEGGKIVGKKLSADRLAKMMLGQKLYWQKKREAAEHDI